MNSLPLSAFRPSRGRERLTDVVDGAAHPLLALIQASAAGHPASADVHGAEGVEVFAFGAVPAMGHQAYFQEGESVFIPFGESAKGDGSLE